MARERQWVPEPRAVVDRTDRNALILALVVLALLLALGVAAVITQIRP